MKLILKLLLFFLIFNFYWNIGNNIQNRTEAEDIYEYALMVENGSDHEWFYHKHHLAFGPTVCLINDFLYSLGIIICPLGLMRIISALSATGTLILFYLFCYKRYSLGPISSALATICFGMMYGFCRYAGEAEIPIIATFFMIASIFVLTSQKLSFKSFFLGTILSILSVLMHVMNIVAVFIAIPLFFILTKKFRVLIIHIVINLVVIFMIYNHLLDISKLFDDPILVRENFDLSNFLKALIGFFQALVSFDFVLGFSNVRLFLTELFSSRMLSEEFYFGERLTNNHIIFSTITFIMLLIVTLYALFRSIKIWSNSQIKKTLLLPVEGRRAFILPVVFFIGYSFLLILIEPGNPELWVMGLMPFSLLLCGLVFVPLTYDNKLWVPFLAVLILSIHNNMALSVLDDESKDYNIQKSKNILSITKSNDIIVTAGNPVFERHLRYHSNAKIVYLYTLSSELFDEYNEDFIGKNIYILGDVFEPIPSMVERFEEKSAQIKIFSDKIKNNVLKIKNDEFGGLYILINKEKKL